MNPRELIISILGLAIVAVVLRGLYVALQAKRGQIKLSIDKNIPQDIDLEALELAELPGGGARVVARSLESVNVQNSRLDEAQERAAALNLGDTEPHQENIPVLMDAVELGQAKIKTRSEEPVPADPKFEDQPESEADWAPRENSSPEFDQQQGVDPQQEFDPQQEIDPQEEIDGEPIMPSFNPHSMLEDEEFEDRNKAKEDAPADDYPNHSVEVAQNSQLDGKDEDGEYDDVLLDYDSHEDGGEDRLASATDNLSKLAPDYAEDEHASEGDVSGLDEDWNEGELNASQTQQTSAAENSRLEGQHLSGDDWDELESPDESLDESSDNTTIDEEQAPAPSFEQQLDDFSMTAGERIGYNDKAAAAPTKSSFDQNKLAEQERLSEQSNLFDDGGPNDQDEQAVEKVGRRASFFSAFRRKPKVLVEPVDAASVETTDSQDAAQADTEIVYSEITSPDVDVSSAKSEQVERADSGALNTQPTEVLVVNVMAREGYAFAGDDLLQILITAGLKFGEMNIFHHHIDSNAKAPVLFSVANVLNPGVFDLNNMNDFTTLGVSFFLALPTSMNNLDAFELMLAVAQQVKGGLDGELRDDERNLMTAQTIEHYRQRVRDFELRQLKAGIRS